MGPPSADDIVSSAATLEVTPTTPAQPGWVRRLWGYMLLHRRDLVLALIAAGVVERVPDHRPPYRASDRRYGDRYPYLIALAVARDARRSVTGLVRLSLHPPVPGRPDGARRAVRPAQRHARAPPGPRLRQPGPYAHGPAGGPGQLRLDAGTGSPQLLLHHERQRAPDAVLAGRHVLPVPGARGGQPDHRPVTAHRVLPHAPPGLPSHVGRAAARGRGGADRRRGHQRCARGEGLRPGGPRAPAGRRRLPGGLRLPDARRPPAVALPTAARGHPDHRTGGHPGLRRVAGPAPRDHPGHVPGLLDLHRPAGLTGPPTRRRLDHRSAGTGWDRAHLPTPRSPSRHCGCPRCNRIALS